MSLQDVPDSSTHMDTGPIQSPEAAMPQTAFASIVPAHVNVEDHLLQNQIPQHESIPIFPHSADSAALHIPLSNTSPSTAGIAPIDTLTSPTSVRAPRPGLISNFPPPLAFLASLDTHPPVSSSTTPPSNTHPQSIIPSPFPLSSSSAIPPPSTTIMTSLSPSTSFAPAGSASSATLTCSGSDVAFSSLNGVAPSITQEPPFVFSPSDVGESCSSVRGSTPSTPTDSQLMMVGDMLKSIAQTAQSASAAFSLGQGFEAGARIDELKKTITLVSELLAGTHIADPQSVSRTSSPRRHSGLSGVGSKCSISPPSRNPVVSGAQDIYQSVLHFTPSPGQDLSVVDGPYTADGSDLSRKRCASSMAGDRAQKTLKREPQEDTPLHFIPAATTNPPIFASSAVPSMTDPLTVPSFVPANSSQPTHRSTGSADLLPSAFNMLAHPPSQLSIPGIPISIPIPTTAAPSTTMEFVTTSAVYPSHFTPTTTGAPSSWSDAVATVTQRTRQHSVSGGSFNNAVNFHSIPNNTSASLGPIPFSSTGSFSTSPTQPRPISASAVAINSPIGRVSRSGSVTNKNTFAFGLAEIPPILDFSNSAPPSSHSAVGSILGTYSPTSSQDGENDNDSDSADPLSPESSSGRNPRVTTTQTPATRSVNAQGNRHGTLATRLSTENIPTAGSAAMHGNEVPQEYRAEVDRIFFQFLNAICSNLDATDAKGEPIHQTLMAKKMQRLDESPDFRPFKFRIQAFTNAFLEELAKQGYPEEKIPMKKIRNYLWNQPYISRFNEEGKKTKSKGNHIWNIDAKKNPDGGWSFRPFHRRVAGSPPSVAYVGLRWLWAPRIWDPQAPRTNLNVSYGSPSLPSWLSWEANVLQGTPPPDAESCDITVEAHFVQDGVEERLSQTFHINVAPVSTLDTSFASHRRSSLNGDQHKPKRICTEANPQSTSPRAVRLQGVPVLAPHPNPVAAAHDAQVMQVLTTAAQRVAQEAQSQVVSITVGESIHELQALAKQQHVLTVTAQAFDQEVSGLRADGTASGSTVLAAAAQQVVFQAARQVAADRSAVAASQMSAGWSPPPAAVTVNEVSVATQSAVAQAVEITGPLSSEVDVLMTASTLLQQQILAPVSPPAISLDPSQRALPSADTTAAIHHSGGNISTESFPLGLTTQTNPPAPFPQSVPSLSEFGRLS